MADKILLRGDSKANWESVNPVLSAREMVVETDTNRTKIGDGISTYTQLAYSKADGLYKTYICDITVTNNTVTFLTPIVNELGITGWNYSFAGQGRIAISANEEVIPQNKSMIELFGNNYIEPAGVKYDIGIMFGQDNDIQFSFGYWSQSGSFTYNEYPGTFRLKIIVYN